MKTIELGQTLTCTETGKQFIAARDGCSFNYARDSAGNIFSDDGVNIRECRELLDRSKPFFCYLSSDGHTITGWKGNVLGKTEWYYSGRVGFARNGCYVSVIDVHGNHWYGKNAGKGICITLRAKNDR